MIGYINGVLSQINNDSCIIDVHGVGYCIYCSKGVLRQLGEMLNEEQPVIKLFTQLIHREDTLDLYGFLHRDEHTLFNLLLTVSGVGPKQAIKILGQSSISDLVHAVQSEDSRFLSTIPGIGEKKAKQIIIELKGKVDKLFETVPSSTSPSMVEAVTALESLGFSLNESRKAVEKALSEHDHTDDVAGIVEQALKHLSP